MTRLPPDPQTPGAISNLAVPSQWVILVAGSVVLATLLELIALPAALLLGPMLAGILLATNGGQIRVPRLPVTVAQTMVGLLVARSITGDIVVTFFKSWPLFLAVVAAIIATSAALGWMIARLKVLPGTTAVWGVAPGGASVMMLMSGEFGADARLVAFMQYLRVVLVAAAASLVARLWVGAAPVAPEIVWFPHFAWSGFIATIAIALLGGLIGVAGRCWKAWASSRSRCRRGCLRQATRCSAGASVWASRATSSCTPIGPYRRFSCRSSS